MPLYILHKVLNQQWTLLITCLLFGKLGFAQLNATIDLKLTIIAPAKHLGDTLFIAGNFNNWNPNDLYL